LPVHLRGGDSALEMHPGAALTWGSSE
jgi:hypothetical protein